MFSPPFGFFGDRAAIVFVFCFFTVLFVQAFRAFRVRRGGLLLLAVLYWGMAYSLSAFTDVFAGFFADIELNGLALLAFAFILALLVWGFLGTNPEVSLFGSNVLLMILFLPVVLDWLLSEQLPSLLAQQTYGGVLVWDIMKAIASIAVGVVFTFGFRPKRQT